jgi:uncharacterized membrane protein YraQ (UPF0718 family)
MTALPSQSSTTSGSLPLSTPATTQTAFRRRLFPVLSILIVLALVWIMLSSGSNPAVTIEIFTTRFLGIFIEAVPFLLLGTLVSGLLETFISREDIVRWLPKNPILATIGGAFMGFAFPVCECGVVPVTRRLFSKGLPMSVGVAFLLAAPVMNPIVLASTYAAFGFGPVLIGRFLITAIVAIAVGVVFAISAKPEDTLLPVTLLQHDHDHGPAPKTFSGRILQSLKIGGDEFFEMGRYLVIGSMLAALMQTVVSQETLLSLGSGPLISVIVMQLLAFVLSVCSTVDSFLALAFVGTFTTGSIISFLTFGPMVDIKSTLMFMGVFKRRTVFYLIVLPFLMTLLAGVWINLLFR